MTCPGDILEPLPEAILKADTSIMASNGDTERLTTEVFMMMSPKEAEFEALWIDAKLIQAGAEGQRMSDGSVPPSERPVRRKGRRS